MERDEIERVEKELDAVLQLVEPQKNPKQEQASTKKPPADALKTAAQKETQGNGGTGRRRFEDENGARRQLSGEKEEYGPSWETQESGLSEERQESEREYQQEFYGEEYGNISGQAEDEDDLDLWEARVEVAPSRGGIRPAAPSAQINTEQGAKGTSPRKQTGEEYGFSPGQSEPEDEAAERKRKMWLLRPNDSLLAAFFVPVIVMVIIFAQRGIFPFGEECFLRTDMYHQYAPFFSEFQYKLTHGGSLLYSWDIGMGVNFSALYAYYLASPVNWLVLLCPKPYIIEFMTVMIVIKTGLSGLSFTWYLRRHFKTRDFGAGFFGIFYALSGYMAAYSWNIMWLDCIMLFPLILLGLERLVKEKKGVLYCVALGLSILSNYYISIMTCIFMVIYVIAQMMLNPPKKVLDFFGVGFRFAFYSLLAGGLSAVVLLPEIYALQATASGNFDFPKTFTSYFSIFDMIARHIGNVGTEIGLEHWPNIYCGVAVLMFFLLYLGSRRISLKEKVVYCGLLLVFYASFSTNVLNFIWHGFHYPNSLPCRQSYIYIAMMLVICYHAYIRLEETPWKHVCLAFWGAVSFVLLAEKLVDNPEQFHFSVFYVGIFLIAIYAGLIYLYKKGKWSVDAVLLTALTVVALESAVNMAVTSVPTTSRTSYVKDNQDVQSLAWNIKADTFYRMEKADQRTKNDGAWMNFPSVSLFSSTADASLSNFFKVLGCESSTNAYSITGSTPLVNSLFSVRYGLYPEQQNSELLMQAGHKGSVWLYENKYTLPVAFMLPQDVESNWITDYGDPASVQNDLCDVLGVEQVLIANESLTDGKRLSFTAQAYGDYYVYVENKSVKEVSAVIGENTINFDNVDRGYFIELGYIGQGERVNLEAKDEGSPTLKAQVWRFNPQGLKAVHEALNKNPISLTSWTDRTLEGSITAEAPGVMYTSVPYDKGWTVTVDGVQVTPRKLFDTFLGVDLGPGNHNIKLSYEPQGLRAGAWITGACAVILAAAAATERSRRIKQEKKNSRVRR